MRTISLHVAEAPARAPAGLRADPYRLFFPLGIALGWLGVGQWLLFSLGLGGGYRIVFHAMVQVQGFLACFVTGFLFTFIPRRTATAPPAGWQLWVTAACPVFLAAFAWRERWAASQLFWFVHLGVLLQFVASRARHSKNPRPAPASLVWIPAGLAFGAIGAVLTAFPATHGAGRGLVLEGMVGALVMGIGAMLVPVITRAEPPAAERDPVAARAVQGALVLLYAASFLAPGIPPRAVYAVRLAIAGAVLIAGAKLWRRPTQPGLNRRAVFAAAWGLPAGYAVLTAFPDQRALGLHVVFLAGFGLLALTVGQHVVAAHAGQGGWLAGKPRATGGLLACTALAIAARSAMGLDPAHLHAWMTTAVAAFLAAGACWLWGMAPMVLPRPLQ